MRVGKTARMELTLSRKEGGNATRKQPSRKEPVCGTQSDTSRVRRGMCSFLSPLPHCGQTERNTERPVSWPKPQERHPLWKRERLSPLPKCRTTDSLPLTLTACRARTACVCC